jgi:predicted RNase H-like HicB family nuclease
MRKIKLTAITQREEGGYVSLCPELDIASQGESREEARTNLTEAVEGFLEAASESEIAARLQAERYVESLEVDVA